MESVYAVLKKVKADVLLFLFHADLSRVLSFYSPTRGPHSSQVYRSHETRTER